MATKVYETEDVVLQDDSQLHLKRINIKSQRKFMATLESMSAPNSQDEAYDQLVDLVEICLEGLRSDLAPAKDADEAAREAARDKIEELFDEPTIYKVIEVCAGIKLNDPNLLAVAAAAMTEQERTGQN